MSLFEKWFSSEMSHFRKSTTSQMGTFEKLIASKMTHFEESITSQIFHFEKFITSKSIASNLGHSGKSRTLKKRSFRKGGTSENWTLVIPGHKNEDKDFRKL